MDDLISRKQAIDAVMKNEHSTDITLMGDAFGKGYTEGYKEEQSNVLQYLADLPSAQPKRGKWIKTARWGRVYYCNQCRNYLDFDGVNAGRGSTNFCPNCGSYNGGENEI